MIIRGKKYIYSKGLAFYAEMESERLAKELMDGWQIERVNWLGFYRLKEVVPEEKQVMIDFYTGKKADVDEYVSFYEAAGWDLVTSYRHRYFIFKAEKNLASVYTDEDSFTSRINSERLWFMLNAIVACIVGLIVMGVINYAPIKQVLMIYPVVYFLLFFAAMVGILFPLSTLISMLYFKVSYGKRTAYYKKPNAYAKKQKFIKDLLLLALLGGITGLIWGIIASLIH